MPPTAAALLSCPDGGELTCVALAELHGGPLHPVVALRVEAEAHHAPHVSSDDGRRAAARVFDAAGSGGVRLTKRGVARYVTLSIIYGVLAFGVVVLVKIFTCRGFLEGADRCDRPVISFIEFALLAGYGILMLAIIRADLTRYR